MKLHRLHNSQGLALGYMFYCPGCDIPHSVYVDKPSPSNGCQWSFNGDMEKPTFSPSFLIPGQCHCYITNGRIQFLSDCTHALAGRTVDIPDMDISTA